MRFLHDFLDLLWTFSILVVNTKITYTESEVTKGNKMFCCFERDFSAGRTEEAWAFKKCWLLLARHVGKGQWYALGRSAGCQFWSVAGNRAEAIFPLSQLTYEGLPYFHPFFYQFAGSWRPEKLSKAGAGSQESTGRMQSARLCCDAAAARWGAVPPAVTMAHCSGNTRTLFPLCQSSESCLGTLNGEQSPDIL